MARVALRRKEKWTLTFEPRLKTAVIREARRRGMYPVAFLEEMVRDRLNPFGHADVTDSAGYVLSLRRASAKRTDVEFLRGIRAWQESVS